MLGPSGWSEAKFLAYPPFWTTSVSRWISAFLAPPAAVQCYHSTCIQVAVSVIGGDDCGNAIQTWRRAAENLGKEIYLPLGIFFARCQKGIRRWNFNGTRGKVMKSNCEKNYFEIFFLSGQRWRGCQPFFYCLQPVWIDDETWTKIRFKYNYKRCGFDYICRNIFRIC